MFYTSNKIIVGKKITEGDNEFLLRFWAAVTEHMEPWQELGRKELSKKALREEYIATQSVILQAFGRVGRYFYLHKEDTAGLDLSGLSEINWKRSASIWDKRVLKNGRVLVNKKAVMLTGNVIKNAVGIPLDEDEIAAEKELANS